MKTIYFDLISGASGDMMLASLIDLGFPVDYLEQQLNKLGIGEIRIGLKKVKRNGISCSFIDPQWQQSTEYRHIGEILEILKRGAFSQRVIEQCESVLNRLATAESIIHGIEKEHVHFHEIGAVDTIIDILGVCLALEYIDIQKINFSAITDGHGSIKCEHGILPVPVPATAQMLQGYHIKILDIPTELCTPTGAALLTSLGEQVLFGVEGKLVKTGYSCGTKKFKEYPNIMRALLYDCDKDEYDSKIDSIDLIETDMDHISGEIMGNVAKLLMEEGALDVSWIPLFMKKGRPGYRLSVMVKEGYYQKMVDLIIIHTRTLGVRVTKTKRILAERDTATIEFLGNSFAEKKCSYKGYCFSKLEYEAIEIASRSSGIPILSLMDKYTATKAGL